MVAQRRTLGSQGRAPTPVYTRSKCPAGSTSRAIAYFCAAELLANVAKHSGSIRTEISVTSDGEGFRMTVTDDGSGQARLSPGGGLKGLLARVQTVDGQLTVDSPAGGPTRITVSLPGHA
jgi:signal transduction histidine kinase